MAKELSWISIIISERSRTTANIKNYKCTGEITTEMKISAIQLARLASNKFAKIFSKQFKFISLY